MSAKPFKKYIETLNMEELPFYQVFAIQNLISLAGKHYAGSTEIDALTKAETDAIKRLEKLTKLKEYEFEDILNAYWAEAINQIEGAYYQGFIDAMELTCRMARNIL